MLERRLCGGGEAKERRGEDGRSWKRGGERSEKDGERKRERRRRSYGGVGHN